MKKIISILLLLLFFSNNLSFAQSTPTCQCTNGVVSSCPTASLGVGTPGSNCTCYYGKDVITCTETTPTVSDNVQNRRTKCNTQAINDTNINYINEDTNGKCCYEKGGESSGLPLCDPNNLVGNKSPSKSVMGITCNQEQLVNGQCKLNIYDTLGIRKSVRDTDQATSVGLFVQDIILSATFFIGTLVTIALVVSGIMFIFAASSGKDPANAKKGIIGSLVGLLIVVSSYVIIRLVQYIAKGF